MKLGAAFGPRLPKHAIDKISFATLYQRKTWDILPGMTSLLCTCTCSLCLPRARAFLSLSSKNTAAGLPARPLEPCVLRKH